ncbi:hypothetical protein CF65_01035 [Aggregatibacter actinomycetemcomitans HK1651]|nr:hypothetical protein ANH9381_0965 [Aggregatibacter actinomycetemcomitans ANH9381]AHN71484.1 hypothetical protein CF65_01035 [Aggregatibacter actinomycetemcomitans HK1651]
MGAEVRKINTEFEFYFYRLESGYSGVMWYFVAFFFNHFNNHHSRRGNNLSVIAVF